MWNEHMVVGTRHTIPKQALRLE